MLKLDTFIKMAQEKHGDKYDYSKVVMNGVSRHIIIGCKVHGEFTQAPSSHLHTSGCVVYMWECEWKVRSNTPFSISDKSGENLPKVG